MDTQDADQVVDYASFDTPQLEIKWIVRTAISFLEQGLQPEDILVISLDDRHARAYFKALSALFAVHSLSTNNIIADPFSEPPFTIEGKITLSTVYRAKGNEAALVFALGIDAIDGRARAARNKLFTAFTRSKAWLRVSGVGANARKLCDEIGRAQEKFPYLEFVMPDPAQIEMIQRDLSEKAIKAKRLRDEYVTRLRNLGMSEDEITEFLRIENKDKIDIEGK